MKKLILALIIAAVAVLVVLAFMRDPTGDAPDVDVNDPVPESGTDDVPEDLSANVATYSILADESTIGWEGSKVTETHIGGFSDFAGVVRVPDGNLEQLTVEVTVQMDSLYSDAGGLTETMKDPTFFDVATHPESTFHSTDIKKGDGADEYLVSGNFTLNGITKNITFPATITIDDDTLTSTSEFAIVRQDWNIVYQGVGDGVIYDKALIRFEAIAKAQSQSAE